MVTATEFDLKYLTPPCRMCYYGYIMNERKPKTRVRKASSRESVLIRLDSDLAAWLQSLADSSGRSRNELMASWIEALHEAHEFGQWAKKENLNPDSAFDFLGPILARCVVDLGVGGSLVKLGRELHEEEQRRRLVEAEQDRIEMEVERRLRAESDSSKA